MTQPAFIHGIYTFEGLISLRLRRLMAERHTFPQVST